MSVSASEIDKMESRDGSKKKAARRRYTEAYRVEAVQYYLKAREIDPKKTIKECAKELGVNEKTLDEANRRIGEPGTGNEFPRKASAFFARNQARATGTA